MSFFRKKSNGQGILEVLIAIYIATVGILSIVNLVLTNIQVEKFNHNMLIATNLAKEGIEIVRGARDTNWISGNSFDSGLTPISPGANSERTFIIFNHFMSTIDNKNGYTMEYVGASWNNCIRDSYSWLGLSAPCKLTLMWKIFDSTKKMYVHPGSYSEGEDDLGFENTNFYRIIYINDICYSSSTKMESIIENATRTCERDGLLKIGMQVISQVGWMESGGMKTTKIEERLYNWR